jgi:hypothetical protein
MASRTEGDWEGQDPAKGSVSPSRQQLLGVTHRLANGHRTDSPFWAHALSSDAHEDDLRIHPAPVGPGLVDAFAAQRRREYAEHTSAESALRRSIRRTCKCRLAFFQCDSGRTRCCGSLLGASNQGTALFTSRLGGHFPASISPQRDARAINLSTQNSASIIV